MPKINELIYTTMKSPAPTLIVGIFGTLVFILTGSFELGSKFILSAIALGIFGVLI